MNNDDSAIELNPRHRLSIIKSFSYMFIIDTTLSTLILSDIAVDIHSARNLSIFYIIVRIY